MIIAFANHKGGTGKTTTVLNIGSVLRSRGKKVLLVDFDPQANLSYSLGIHDPLYTVADLLAGESAFYEVVQQAQGIDILPASFSLNSAQDKMSEIHENNYLLRNVLAGTDYDFVLIDCPPAISVFTKNALYASRYVVIPMLMEALSVQGLSRIVEVVYEIQNNGNPELEILGALGVIVDERRQLTNEILEYIDSHFFVPVFNNRIRNNVKAAEAPSFACGVVDYAPNSGSAKDYVAVTGELLKKLNLS